MKHTLLFGSFAPRTEREARLCFLNVPNNNAPQNTITRLEGIADTTANVIQTGAEKAVAFGRDFPVLSTVVKGIYNVSQQNIDVKTQENLVDRAEWVDTFQFDATEFWLTKQPPIDIDRTRPVTPKVLFHAMTPEQRRAVFFEHVDLLIPEGVRKGVAKDPSFASPEVRLDAIGEDGVRLYRRAMVGILGMDRLDGEKDAHSLAKTSLEQHYATGHFPGTVTRGFEKDYTEALRRNSLTGKEPFATMPQALYDKLPPSGFKGALMLGVIDTPKLRTMNKIFVEHEHDLRVSKADTARTLDELGGITKARMRKEAKGVAQIWGELGGFEKIALLAAGAFALRTKFGQGIGMIFGGAYFFHKFVLKDKDPLKSWSNNAKNNLINPIKEKLSPVLGPYKDDLLDPAGRSDIVHQFLDSSDRKNMSPQALGLSVILDLPLDVLATNFKPTGSGTFSLNLGNGGTIDDAVRIKDPAMNRAYRVFTSSPDNRKMATEAIANVFYRIAKRNPMERRPVEVIERVMNRLPSGTTMLAWSAETLRAPGGASYTLLPHRESGQIPQSGPSVPGTQGIPNAHKPVAGVISQEDLLYAGEQYIRLVQAGHSMATGDATTLRSFMQKDMDLEKYEKKDKTPPGPAKNPAPGPAQNQNPPGPNNAVPPGPANNLPPGPANNVPPGPANNAPPGPVNNVPPGPALNVPPGPVLNPPPGPAVNPAPGPVLNPPPGPILNPPPGPVVPPAPGPAAPAAPGAAPAPAPGPVAPAAPGAAPAAAPGPIDPMVPGPVVPPAPGSVDVDPAGPAANPAPAPVDINPAGPADADPVGPAAAPAPGPSA